MSKIIISLLLLIYFAYSKENIYVKAKKEGPLIVAYAYNYTNNNANIKYNAKYTHLSPLCVLPINKTLSKNSKTIICKYLINQKNFTYSGNYKLINNNKHDDAYIYRLPYKINTKQKVTQAYNSLPTHKGKSRFAIDFGLKEGTEIYAIREGKVIEVKEKSNLGGNTKKYLPYANSILIKHKDNSYVRYSHLKYNGVVVNVGNYVKKGQFLGYSGNTGYTGGAHLHLVVFINNQSIPIKFKTKRGILTNPIKGMYYTAVK